MIHILLYGFLQLLSVKALADCHAENSCLGPQAVSLVQRRHSRNTTNVSLAVHQLPILECTALEPCSCRGVYDSSQCYSGIVPYAPPGLCTYTNDRCQAKLAWFHVMKAGSTFGATLAHFANGSLPSEAHMPSCGALDDSYEDACPGGAQGEEEFFVYKYPKEQWFPKVFWSPDDNDPGNHRSIHPLDWKRWQGSFVGMFRQPEERMVSAFNHFAEGKGDLLSFRKYTLGTVTKMLAGTAEIGIAVVRCSFEWLEKYSNTENCTTEDCLECIRDPGTDLDQALTRLDGFGFIGLTEHYNLSVCLFHVMFGGECLPIEFANMRSADYVEDPAVLLEKLQGLEDPYDNAIYSKASTVFWDRIARYGINQEKCERQCPGAVERYQADFR
mmetsp:Transcript_79650/g.140588  ORF Transcript_79650/g.140588 Transcript_79650/m.140588 type:complete len:386 (-) Transcript_79650:152-1309(-)|eukprot:CAMPEP_0197664506 /NCGR_PEP_ID=MMETSP1338-20131121/58678_1 /TAXON_ID=43686 ORGANISM="Pelagodinium beii, Strain RCC1491" /NCGR_SAMPLE_ID=MMETSP1338 /ASSEMBLY_ACC=CAM_ASM_000754 /LENGTH=385 /DNA_ID=CAMNT_0043243163 /DNA_START=211 /DNA_END=1368 /DNA_ORIENTATION=+